MNDTKGPSQQDIMYALRILFERASEAVTDHQWDEISTLEEFINVAIRKYLIATFEKSQKDEPRSTPDLSHGLTMH